MEQTEEVFLAGKKLTEKELSLIFGLACGMTNKQLAQSMGRAESTIKNETHLLRAKVQAETNPHLVCMACDSGIIDGIRAGLRNGYVAVV